MRRVIPQHTSQQSYSANALLGNRVTLPGQIETLSSSYRATKPFPHLVIDGLFSIESLEELFNEIVLMPNHNWMHHNEDRLEQFNSRSAAGLDEAGFQRTALVHSATFKYFLSALTGIWNLLPDAHLEGGGYKVMPPGGTQTCMLVEIPIV